jgi:hypothetical protein
METTTLPVYKEKDTSILNTSTTTPPCTHTPTPHLSSAIASPQTHAHLIAATTALTAATQEMRAAKKEGRWSHEEKRALKMEVKGLLKGMKRDVKGGWRKETEEGERKVQRGWYWKR